MMPLFSVTFFGNCRALLSGVSETVQNSSVFLLLKFGISVPHVRSGTCRPIVLVCSSNWAAYIFAHSFRWVVFAVQAFLLRGGDVLFMNFVGLFWYFSLNKSICICLSAWKAKAAAAQQFWYPRSW